MGFNKKKGIAAVSIILLLTVFNVITFLLPILHTVTFWIGYSFTMLAGILFLACTLFLFNSDSKERTFMRLPVAKIGWIYFIIQMAAGVWQITNFGTSYISALLIDCVLTGLFIVTVLSSKAAIESVEAQESYTASKVMFLKNIQSILSTIKTPDDEISEKIEALKEDFRFSDPMSHSMLSELEKQIESKAVMLKSDVNDKEKALAEIECISDLLKERNQKCKMYKNVKEDKPPKDNSGVKYVAVTVAILGTLATVALVICFIIIPNNIYKNAMELYNNEKYAEAKIIFMSLDDFSDSKQMALACDEAANEKLYLKAGTLFESKEYEEAIAIYETLGSYKDSEEMIKASRYAMAGILFEDKKYDEAIAIYEELDTYKDSKEMINSAKDMINADKYAAAEKAFDNQDYVNAIKLYKALGDYKDSVQKLETINNRLAEDDVLYFGTYKNEPIAWRVIESETDNDEMLLIAKDAICELPYNDEIKSVSWDESSLYSWLNGEFLNSFSEEQLSDILPSKVDGSEVKVYLLDQTSAEMLEDQELLKSNKDWWLRTADTANAVYVTADGDIVYDGDSVVRAKGVRPCILIDLT